MSNLPRLTSINRIVRMAYAGEHGRGWYAHAREQVERASGLLGIDPVRFAELLALYSPRVSVKRSIRFAIRYATDGSHADDVMRGIRSSVEHWEATGEIRGPKTAPFARALLGDGDAIVLDVWMAAAFGIDQKLFNRQAVHRECCRRIRIAAKRLGWTPAEVQAAVWTSAVRSAGRKPAQFEIVTDSLFGPRLEIAA